MKQNHEIRFILKKIEVKGSTVYSQSAFKRWQQRFIDKKVSLALIYRFAEKITTKYRNDGYLLSRAIVVPQKIKDGVVTIKVIEGYINNVSEDLRDFLRRNGIKIYTDRFFTSMTPTWMNE